MPNQYKSLPQPRDELEKWITYYWQLGFSDPQIADLVLGHFDKLKYGLSAKSVSRVRSQLGLKGTKQAMRELTPELFRPLYEEIRKRFPNLGARGMRTHLRQNYGLKVSEPFLLRFLNEVEPQLIQKRKQRRFRRHRCVGAGAMETLAIDQHDKWKRFGLFLHAGLDPFIGRIVWIKIWWTNRNPILITSYYIEAARKIHAIPLVTQSDPGSENNGIANAHTSLRHHLDPSLNGTLQHRWMSKAKNIKSEALWSDYRRHFAPGFEDIINKGVLEGLYNSDNPLERLVFRWIAIPWLQLELDAWVNSRNTSRRRANKHKILPQGIPDMMHANPQEFGIKNFMVRVDDRALDNAERKWANPDHPVFQLTPPSFDSQISKFYQDIGQPIINSNTLWAIYSALLAKFQAVTLSDVEVGAWQAADERAFEAQVDLLEGQKELRMGGDVIACDSNSLFTSESSDFDDGPGDEVIEYGSFTDEETGHTESELEVAGLVFGALRDDSE